MENHSYPHDRRKIGVREGEVHSNDPKTAKEIVDRFEVMVSKAEKISMAKDPLEEILEHPRDWGIETDASNVDEVIYD